MRPVKKYHTEAVRVHVKAKGRRTTTIDLPSAEEYADRIKERAESLVREAHRRKMADRSTVGRAFAKAASRSAKQ